MKNILNKASLGILLFTTPQQCWLKGGIILDVRLVFHWQVCFTSSLRKGLKLNARLNSLKSFSLPLSKRGLH